MSSASIRASISARKAKREEYARRLSAVQKVLKALREQFDDDVSRARKQNEQLTEHLERGLKGGSLRVSQVCEQIDAAKEKQVWSDTSLSGASADIEAEASRCVSEISRLDAEISSLQSQLAVARRAEAEAAKPKLL